MFPSADLFSAYAFTHTKVESGRAGCTVAAVPDMLFQTSLPYISSFEIIHLYWPLRSTFSSLSSITLLVPYKTFNTVLGDFNLPFDKFKNSRILAFSPFCIISPWHSTTVLTKGGKCLETGFQKPLSSYRIQWYPTPHLQINTWYTSPSPTIPAYVSY